MKEVVVYLHEPVLCEFRFSRGIPVVLSIPQDAKVDRMYLLWKGKRMRLNNAAMKWGCRLAD